MPLKPTKPFSLPRTNSHAWRKASIEREDRAMDRARRRKKIFVKARELLRETESNVSHVYDILMGIYEDPEHPFNEELPSKPTLYAWFDRWGYEGAIPDLWEFRDAKRGGAPLKTISEEVWRTIETQVLALKCPGPTELARKVNEKHGDGTLTRWVAQRCYHELGEQAITGGWHGAKAAVGYAMPKLKHPTERTNERWVLDEFVLPVCTRVFDASKERWRSEMPWCCVVMEERSRAILAFAVFEPNAQGNTKAHSWDDVISVLFSAAIPELASPAVRDMVGEVPACVRMDNLPAHNGVVDFLQKAGMGVPGARSYTPWSRGDVEKLVGDVKKLFRGTHGWSQTYQPVVNNMVYPGRARSLAVGRGRLVPRRIPVAVEDLLTIPELREEIDRQIRYHNGKVHSALDGLTPRQAFFKGQKRDESLFSANDLIGALDTRTVKLGKKLTCLGTNYAPFVDGEPLYTGQSYDLRVDLQSRCAWLAAPHGFVLLETDDDYARRIDPAEHVIREAAAAREHSDRAAQLLRQHVANTRGQDVVDRGERALVGKGKATKAQAAINKAKAEAEALTPNTSAPPATPATPADEQPDLLHLFDPAPYHQPVPDSTEPADDEMLGSTILDPQDLEFDPPDQILIEDAFPGFYGDRWQATLSKPKKTARRWNQPVRREPPADELELLVPPPPDTSEFEAEMC